MGIPEHNLCVKNHKLARAYRHKPKLFGRSKGYGHRDTVKDWRRQRTRLIIDMEWKIHDHELMQRHSFSSITELNRAFGIKGGRYGKYDD